MFNDWSCWSNENNLIKFDSLFLIFCIDALLLMDMSYIMKQSWLQSIQLPKVKQDNYLNIRMFVDLDKMIRFIFLYCLIWTSQMK